MTAFIFVGDMLVMLFMIVVVVWVSLIEPEEKINYVANIPLEDEPEDTVNHG